MAVAPRISWAPYPIRPQLQPGQPGMGLIEQRGGIIMRIWFVIVLGLMCGTAVQAQIPPTLTYQGVLQDNQGTPVPDGDYTVRFKLYTVPTGGNQS